LQNIVRKLQSDEGCPWDKVQTHKSIKAGCIEEACEVLAGINILAETGKSENLKEELGDLLLQVIFHANLAEKEGLFDLQDVARAANEKMIRRHPHVFHEPMLDNEGQPVTDWAEIKKLEKAGREWEEEYLPVALEEGLSFIKQAAKRKGLSV
jgi:tetrapyrrole methylase family protein/MazG family protein